MSLWPRAASSCRRMFAYAAPPSPADAAATRSRVINVLRPRQDFGEIRTRSVRDRTRHRHVHWAARWTNSSSGQSLRPRLRWRLWSCTTAHSSAPHEIAIAYRREKPAPAGAARNVPRVGTSAEVTSRSSLSRGPRSDQAICARDSTTATVRPLGERRRNFNGAGCPARRSLSARVGGKVSLAGAS